MAIAKTIRCAVYTRKSTDEGLEQDFNSLHAQREASEAYILSQKHEGWQIIKTEYNDGGYSGGSMNRPALQRLMQDIEAKKVDVIVVYKVDRLSRSLHDFAKMVEIFDRHSVSFVSVTQQFNTTSSMGRLTLNVLLSFAQFEREVTGERIRDKIAASKKKGMWMGGQPPLGYDIVEKRLIVNQVEAQSIKTIFQRYLVLGSVRPLWAELIRDGITNKPRRHGGEIGAAKPFSRGGLYQLLSNPVYLGKVRHKNNIYEGEHVAIIEQSLWDEVQQQLKVNGPEYRERNRLSDRSILAGKLFDTSGEPLGPSHAIKKGKRYRYYVSRSLLSNPASQADQGWRVPAYEMERMVQQAAASILSDKAKLVQLLKEAEIAPQNIPVLLHEAERVCKQIELKIDAPQIIMQLVQRAELRKEGICMQLKLIAEGGKVATVTADMPMQIKRRGIEMRMVVGDCKNTPDPSLLKAVARAHTWFNELVTGRTPRLADIVKRENLDQSYVSRLLKLAFLPPKTVESIILGAQPADWTVNILAKTIQLDMVW